MNVRQYCLVSGALFAIVALAHLCRLVFALPVEIDGVTVPMAVSWAGVIVPAALAHQALRLAGREQAG